MDKIMKINKYNKKDTVVGFESTGSYGEPLAHYLKSKNIPIVQINPMHTKRLQELCDNSPNKTDKKDPKVIADIMQLGRTLNIIIPEGNIAELRRLSHARKRHIESRTRLFNKTHSLVIVIFPEFTNVMKTIRRKSSIYLMQNHPTPENIKELGVNNLTKILKKISKSNLGQTRAEELYKTACNSVGVKEGSHSISLEIKQLMESITLLTKQISEIDLLISSYLNQIPENKYIQSIKGIGEITTAGIIGEIADFSKFGTSAQLEKLAGLNLFERSSGNFRSKLRISKRGRSYLRSLLYFTTLRLVRKDGIYHEDYKRQVDAGKIKNKVLIAMSRKLLRTIYSLVKNEKMYEENYGGAYLKVA
jgi:transposase